MMIRRLLPISLLMCFFFPSSAQYTEVGGGSFQSASNVYGPMLSLTNSPAFNRHAYIYPAASLQGMEHGDTIRSIEFKRSFQDSLQGILNLKIYMRCVQKSNFGAAAINWAAEARDSGMTLVYDKNPKTDIGNKHGWIKFEFNQADYFVYDTAGGKVNLELLVQYTQQTTQNSNVLWFIESNTTVSGFQSQNETKYITGNSTNWLDSITIASSIYKPSIRFNHPRYSTQLELRNIYALGTVPILMNRPDTVKAVVRNVGLETIYGHKVYMEITGANNHFDSVVIDSINPFEELFVLFGDYIPSNIGTEQIGIFIADDDDNADNSGSRVRIVNYNEYSHFDPTMGNAGGIGFNGATGDFVAKFYANGDAWMNQIKVDFSSSNRSFQLVVWEDDGPNGLPGTVLFVSDTQLTTTGTFIMPVLPRIKVSDGYYVGIRQTSTTNVAFSFQYEIPIRPHSFYFAEPAGDTNWVHFNPGFDFNFNIRPRLQVGNDLAITEFLEPVEGDSLLYSRTDSIYPKVRVLNYGFLNQSNFEVKLEIRTLSNLLEHSDTKIISLAEGHDTIIEFEPMSLYNFGNFKAVASVNLNTDSVKDNNSQEVVFHIIKRHDIAADLIFEPVSGDSFYVNTEGFWPQVRVINYGTATQTNFPVTIQLRQNKTVYDFQTKFLSLAGNGTSTIVVFDTMYLPVSGWLTFEAFTDLFRDSFPVNDTSRSQVYGKIDRDIGILSIIKPEANKKLATKITFQPYISFRNHGLKKQDSIYVSARIYNASGALVYADTVERTLDFFSVSQVLFKTYNTSPVPGLYRIVIEADLFGDQVPFNDTLSRWFEVVDGRDLVLMNIVEPDSDTGIVVNAAAVLPSVRIRNNGLVDADSVEILFHVYNESGQLSYADTIRNLHIGLNDTMLVDANRLLEFNTPGDYELYVINAWWDEDLRSLNDSLSYSYTVRYSRDLALLQHLNPISGLEIPINTGLIPRIRIENKGYDTLFNIEVECRILDASSMEVYRDTVYFSFLEFLGKADLNTKLISFTETGLYTMKTRFLGSNDWLANDSLETMFLVIKDYDVSVDSSDFLETSEPFEVNTSYKPTVWVSSLGDKAFAQPVTVYCKVIVDGFDIYFKSQLVDLDSGESLKVEFDSSLTHDAAGPAEIIFFVNEFEDRLRANDTLRLSFMFEDHSSLAYPLGWGLIVYPNPSGGNYHISSSVPVIRYVITDELGKQIGSHNCRNEREIDLNNELPSGVYYLHVYTDFAVQIVKLISL